MEGRSGGGEPAVHARRMGERAGYGAGFVSVPKQREHRWNRGGGRQREHYYQIIPTGPSGFNGSNFTNSVVQEFSQSRNGTRIAFSSSHWGNIENDQGSQRIFIMNADGTGVRQLTFHNPASRRERIGLQPPGFAGWDQSGVHRRGNHRAAGHDFQQRRELQRQETQACG
jgi:hypothetical protein